MSAPKYDESLIEMLVETSGMWRITPERVGLLRDHSSKISGRNRAALESMLSQADQGERFWVCSTEFYLVLNEIKLLQAEPTVGEIEDVYQSLVDGARDDRVDHREWVKKTISLLGRIKGER